MQTQHTCILLEDITEPATCAARPASPTRRPTCTASCRVERGAGEHRPAARARERPARRADAQRRRADDPPRARASCSTRWPAATSCASSINTNGIRIAQDDALLDLLAHHHKRIEVYLQFDGASGRDAPRTTAAPTCAGSRSEAVERLSRARHLHHADDDRGARRQRRRDRRRDAGSRSTRRSSAASRSSRSSARAVRRDRPDGPADAHRRARATRPADRRPGHLARPHRAAVLASALLLGRLPAPRRRRGSGARWSRSIGHDRLQGARPRTWCANRIADTRAPRANCGRPSRSRCSGCCREQSLAVAPAGRRAVARHLRELRPRAVDAAARWPRRRCSAGSTTAAQAARRAGQADHGEAVHGHVAR